MRFIDLFAGIKIVFEENGFECVFSNDFDRYCKITYDYNFSELLNPQKEMSLGDIAKISSDKIPDFDILAGGFLCQPFFVAGYKQGFNNKKG